MKRDANQSSSTPFVGHDLEAAETRRQQQKPDPVDLEPAGGARAAFALENLGFMHQRVDEDKGDHADRTVDE
jgi:hypothetical protein